MLSVLGWIALGVALALVAVAVRTPARRSGLLIASAVMFVVTYVLYAANKGIPEG